MSLISRTVLHAARAAVAASAALAVAALLGGCGTTGLVLGAVGVATDTSVTWAVVKHVHAKVTEGDPVPCQRLDSVQRALNLRCGAFVPGTVLAQDLARPALQSCALGVAAADPRFWPALPEFIEQGARPDACTRSPLVELAQATSCPDFGAASPAVLRAIRSLADTDPRAVHHDVVRMLSCPSAVAAGLDDVLWRWHAAGALEPGRLGFGVLGALHPDQLGSGLARALEARGHTARAGVGAFDGRQPGGFELALRGARWPALEWWLARAPELANRVPPAQGSQLPWLPLARVLVPKFLDDPAQRGPLVAFLLARGADPWQRLPFDAGNSVVGYARSLRSPELALLDPPLQSVTRTAAPVAPGPGQ